MSEIRDAFRDLGRMEEALRGRLLRAMLAAVARTSRAARGHPVFQSDREVRACLTLTRMAATMLGERQAQEYWQHDDPDLSTEERKQLLEILNNDEGECDEQAA